MTTLADAADMLVGFAFKSSGFLGAESEGIRLVRGDNVQQGYLRWGDKTKKWATSETDGLDRYRLAEGDVLLAMDRPIVGDGLKLAWVSRDDLPALLVQRVCRLRGKMGVARTGFLRYVLASSQFAAHIHRITTGANIPHISGKDIAAYELSLPSLDEQDNIVRCMAAYDDLIATNQRRIVLLEEAARLLYREWFVQLRYPGGAAVCDGDGLPQGWERLQLADVCLSLEDGDWIESKDQGGEDYRLLQVSNIGTGRFVETGNYRFITEEAFRRIRCREVVPGDILISRMPDPIGRAWLVSRRPWKMVTAVDVAIAKHNPSKVDPAFLLHHINSDENLLLSGQHASGATRPRISRRQLAALPILVPPRTLQAEYSSIVTPMMATMEVLREQCARLSDARNLLLPKLMSGQLDVSRIPLPEEIAA